MDEFNEEKLTTIKKLDKKIFLQRAFVVFLVLVSFIGGYIFAMFRTQLLHLPLSTFVIQTVQNEYVDPYTDEMLARGIVYGTGDPFSGYMTEEEYQSFETQLSEKYVGIGVLISDQQGRLIIIKVFPGSPADLGGIQPNMEIIRVDEKVVQMQGLEKAASYIRGKAGTQVMLTVIDHDLEKDFLLTRDYVSINTVEGQWLTDEIAYIRILSFNFGTAKKFKETLDDLMTGDPKALILDMRDNSGGVLDETIAIAELFLPFQSVLLQIKDRSGNTSELKLGNNPTFELPLFLMVNRHSASAVEVLAGAIQDHQRGMIMGERTYGKASIQKIFPVPFKGSAVKLTVQRYLTPNGRNIDRTGIEPDWPITDTPRYSSEGLDIPLQKAIEFVLESRISYEK